MSAFTDRDLAQLYPTMARMARAQPASSRSAAAAPARTENDEELLDGAFEEDRDSLDYVAPMERAETLRSFVRAAERGPVRREGEDYRFDAKARAKLLAVADAAERRWGSRQ